MEGMEGESLRNGRESKLGLLYFLVLRRFLGRSSGEWKEETNERVRVPQLRCHCRYRAFVYVIAE